MQSFWLSHTEALSLSQNYDNVVSGSAFLLVAHFLVDCRIFSACLGIYFVICGVCASLE